jgi:hypothetical protein
MRILSRRFLCLGLVLSLGVLADTDKVFPTVIDYDVGLTKLIEGAVGSSNLRYVNSNISPVRFELREGVRAVNLELVPFLDGETSEQAAKRLTDAGYTLEGVGELAQFLADNPTEVAKYATVVALNKMSRWERPSGGIFALRNVFVPCVCVDGAYRGFQLSYFSNQTHGSNSRILVSRSWV